MHNNIDHRNAPIRISHPTIQFLKEWQLWLDPPEDINTIPIGTWITAKGVINFYHDGPGVTSADEPGVCFEESLLKVIELSITDELP